MISRVEYYQKNADRISIRHANCHQIRLLARVLA